MVVGDFPIETDTIVIGAGPGGYVAAIRAAQLGQKVTIVEKGELGGVCLNVGCIPSKALLSASHRFHNAQHSEDMGVIAEKVALNFDKVQEFKNGVVNKLTGGVAGLLKGNKVEVVKGEAYFVDENNLKVMTEKASQTYTFKNAIIATGSRPIEIPNFKFGERVIDSSGALALKDVPKKLVVVGGGYIGSELGTAFANFGSEVTILEGAKDILGGFEKQMTQIVKKGLKAKGVDIVTEAMAKSAEETDKGVKVTYEAGGETKEIEADYVLVTVGRRPNTDDMGLEQAGVEVGERGLITVDKQGRTNVPNIYAIGDIVPGAALAHKASYEAKIAAEAISGKKVAVDYKAMPAVAFTDPELASVGMTIKEAKDAGIEAKAYKFPFSGNGRALSLGKTEGFIRLVTTIEDNVLIGAQIGGVGASDMVSELALAIESGMNAEDIALTIHPHPSLGEIVMDASELALGLPIHI